MCIRICGHFSTKNERNETNKREKTHTKKERNNNKKPTEDKEGKQKNGWSRTDRNEGIANKTLFDSVFSFFYS